MQTSLGTLASHLFDALVLYNDSIALLGFGPEGIVILARGKKISRTLEPELLGVIGEVLLNSLFCKEIVFEYPDGFGGHAGFTDP